MRMSGDSIESIDSIGLLVVYSINKLNWPSRVYRHQPFQIWQRIFEIACLVYWLSILSIDFFCLLGIYWVNWLYWHQIDCWVYLLYSLPILMRGVYRLYLINRLCWSIGCLFGQYIILVYWMSMGSIDSIDTWIDCCFYFIYSIPKKGDSIWCLLGVYLVNRLYWSIGCLLGVYLVNRLYWSIECLLGVYLVNRLYWSIRCLFGQ